ncbi:MAG: DNA-binding protein [Proteobacteria bacterium]|nr:MAG: DNA-binding protein [Pseudomonadota bacterium]
MKTLVVTWQDPKDRRWIPVGRLSVSGDVYRFVYTRGALSSQSFVPFGGMSDLTKQYESTQLFPVFANRLLPRNRPEYQSFVDWLGLVGRADPIALLARSGGVRETDSIEVFPLPEPDPSGLYRMHFFCHGIRYLAPGSLRRIGMLRPRDRLFLMLDFQNTKDPLALALRAESPAELVGYCPRYLVPDFFSVLKPTDPAAVSVEVNQVNPEAPTQFRLLCSLTAKWPQGFEPCSTPEYEALA